MFSKRHVRALSSARFDASACESKVLNRAVVFANGFRGVFLLAAASFAGAFGLSHAAPSLPRDIEATVIALTDPTRRAAAGEMFSEYEAPMFDGARVTFMSASGSQRRLRTFEGGVLKGIEQIALHFQVSSAQGSSSSICSFSSVMAEAGYESIASAASNNLATVFLADDSGCRRGVYILDRDGLRPIVRFGEAFPGNASDTWKRSFGNFSAPVIDGEFAALFVADQQSEGAIFLACVRADRPEIRMVASEHELVPGGAGGVFLGFLDSPSLDGEVVAFQGFGSRGEMGIFIADKDRIFPAVMVGDRIDGRVIVDMRFSSHGLRSGSFAYSAVFSDGASGIFVSPVPTPSILDCWSDMTLSMYAAAPPIPSSSSAETGAVSSITQASPPGERPQAGVHTHAVVRSNRSVYPYPSAGPGQRVRADTVVARLLPRDADRAGDGQP